MSCCYACSLQLTRYCLAGADLSYVLLVTSLGYVVVAIMSAAILDEAITPARWAGTLLIALGVGVVGSTPVSTFRGGE